VAEQTYERQANAYDEATLAVKLDTHDEAVYECSANTRDKATLAAKLNTRSEATYERSTITHGEVTLNESNYKAISAKLASQRSYMKPEG